MSMHMIKGLFFDFDGVITMEKEGSPTIISYISNETGISYETIENAYYKYNDELLYGNITHLVFFRSSSMVTSSILQFQKAFFPSPIPLRIHSHRTPCCNTKNTA